MNFFLQWKQINLNNTLLESDSGLTSIFIFLLIPEESPKRLTHLGYRQSVQLHPNVLQTKTIVYLVIIFYPYSQNTRIFLFMPPKSQTVNPDRVWEKNGPCVICYYFP